MRLYDTHCHLDVSEFEPDRDQVIERARRAGVSDFLVPGIRRDTWSGLLALCNRQAGCHPALGLHPVYLEQHAAADLEELDLWLARERPAAVGEIGLDFALKELDRARQQQLFDAQLALARRHELPVVIHCRKAHDAVLASLKRIPVSGGICHAFNGSLQQAQQYIALGFKLGFGGMLTYERSSKLRRLATELPLEAIVLETDAPDMTVASHRFQRNSPEYLPEVLQVLAALRALPAEAVAAATTANAEQLFGTGGEAAS
jgi:TatD DNase family protein